MGWTISVLIVYGLIQTYFIGKPVGLRIRISYSQIHVHKPDGSSILTIIKVAGRKTDSYPCPITIRIKTTSPAGMSNFEGARAS